MESATILTPPGTSLSGILLSIRTQYSWRTRKWKNISTISLYGDKFYQLHTAQRQQSPLILLKCIECNNIFTLLPFNFLFLSNQTILKRKSLCLNTIETIVISEKDYCRYYWHYHFPIDVVTLPKLLLRYIDSPMYCYIPRSFAYKCS